MMWKQLKQQIKQRRGVLIIAPSVAGLVISGSIAGFFNLLEWSMRDQFFRLRPTESIDKRIVIVTIDESDIKYVQKWPMPDRVMAQFIQNIKAQQPRAIAIDVYRDLPVEPGHQELINTFNSTPNLIGIEKVSGVPIAPPPTLEKLGQVAANDLLLDADGKIRRGLIILGKKDGTMREGFGVKLALMYLEKEGIKLKNIDEKKKIYGLGKAIFVPLSGNEGEYSKADTGGYQILLNYRGELKHFLSISLKDVLENRIPSDLMGDRLVFVGAIAPSLNDNYHTPYTSTLIAAGNLTPGVVIHANLASQILSAALEGRPMLQASAKPLNWLLILFWSGVSATLGSLYLSKRWVSVGGLVFASITIITSGYVFFLSGWLIPVFTPLLAVVSGGVISIGATLWNNLKLSYQKLEEYAHTLEAKNDELEIANRQIEDYAHTLESTNEELRIAKENYLSIFENALEGIFQATPEGHFIIVNPALARIYGYDCPEDLITSAIEIGTQIYVDPSGRDEFKRQMAEQGNVKNWEYQVYCQDGSIIWVQEDTRAVRDASGQLLYYEGIIQDITQRKREEEELKRQLEELKIEIDHQKREREVAQITQSDYFKDLQAEAESLQFDDDW